MSSTIRLRHCAPFLLSLLLVIGCGEAEVSEGEDIADNLAVPPGVSLDPPPSSPATGGLELPGAQDADTTQAGTDAANDPAADPDAAQTTAQDSVPTP